MRTLFIIIAITYPVFLNAQSGNPFRASLTFEDTVIYEGVRCAYGCLCLGRGIWFDQARQIYSL